PAMADDFYRTLMDEQDRKTILQTCPRNIDMVYDPPPLNDVKISADGKRMDSSL
ncbi:hypothetical protein THASP1DRAFT_9043, partial [Thamnocephalis sphaerospora]